MIMSSFFGTLFYIWSLNTVQSKKYEVVIMGAGMAGIAAATQLIEDGMNPKDILIIEGADYIGGRTKVSEFGGHSLNVGASWLEGGCVWCNESIKERFEVNPMLQLAEEFGIAFVSDDFESEIYFDPLYGDPINHTALYAAYDDYYDAYECVHTQYGDTIDTADYDPSKEDDSYALALANCGWTPETMLQTFVEWYDWDFESAVETTQSSAFSTNSIYAIYGPDELYITDPRGFAGITIGLADQLLDKGVSIKLNQIITSVRYGDNHVTVRTENGKKYTGKYGINTFSLGVLQSRTVKFKPTLPTWKQDAIDKHLMADYAVMYIQWPYDWWSDVSNYSEQLLFIDEDKGYFPWAKDLNLVKYFEDSNIWRIDMDNDLARRIQSQSIEDTIDEYMAKLSLYLDGVPEPSDVLITNWTNNRFAMGSFADWPSGFTLDDWELMRKPICNLHFAGEATSREQFGYVSGAYLEGVRAAQEIVLCITEPMNALCANECEYSDKSQSGSGSGSGSWSHSSEASGIGHAMRRDGHSVHSHIGDSNNEYDLEMDLDFSPSLLETLWIVFIVFAVVNGILVVITLS